jgi:hypothetical protein
MQTHSSCCDPADSLTHIALELVNQPTHPFKTHDETLLLSDLIPAIIAFVFVLDTKLNLL